MKIRLTVPIGRKRKKSRWWWRIRRRGPRGMLPGQPRERPIISADREGRIKAPIFGAALDRWSKGLLLFSSRARNALHVSSVIEPSPSPRTRSEWARSLWIVECCSAGRIARDLEGAVERERLIDYALLRAKPQDSPANREGRTRHSRVVSMRLTNCGSRNEIFFF